MKKGIFKGGLEVGDKIKDRVKSTSPSYEVQGVIGNLVCILYGSDDDYKWFTYDWLLWSGFYFVEEEEPKTMTKEEIEKELGYKITII